jgi:Ca-activated chloride channel family protein
MILIACICAGGAASRQGEVAMSRSDSPVASDRAVISVLVLRWTAALSLAALTWSGLGVAQPASRPGMMLYGIDGQAFAQAPGLHTDVSIGVTGMLARVRVSQQFRNHSPDWQEGIYTFPLPENAAVDRMTLRYADRLIEGEIREREQARQVYNAARSSGRGASLVEQQRANIFTAAVANIPPGEVVDVVLEYQHKVEWNDDAFSLRFPMVVAPRYVPGHPAGTEPVRAADTGWVSATDQVPDAALISPPVAVNAGDTLNRLSLAVDLRVGLDLADLDSLYHPVKTERIAYGHYRLMLDDPHNTADRDFVLRWRPQLESQPAAALFTQRRDDGAYSLLMVMPGHQQGEQEPPPRELILVVDTSGSMHGDSLLQARSALVESIRTLRPVDTFNIIRFASDVSGLFDRAQPATPERLRHAERYIHRLQANGGTEMLPALRRALPTTTGGERLRQVVFITDGSVGNEDALFREIAARVADSRLFTVGIGSAPNALFMRQAARHGRGSATFIGDVSEVRERMSELLRQLSHPVMTDLRIVWLDGQGRQMSTPGLAQVPARLPDLYIGQPLSVVVRSESAPASVLIEGRIAGRPWRHRIELHNGANDAVIPALWARGTIDELETGLLLGGDTRELRRRIVDLAVRYRLLTRYTSLVAVDRQPQRPAEEPLKRSLMPVHLPAGWSANAVFGRLPTTATTAPVWLVFGIAGMLAGILLLSYRPGRA